MARDGTSDDQKYYESRIVDFLYDISKLIPKLKKIYKNVEATINNYYDQLSANCILEMHTYSLSDDEIEGEDCLENELDYLLSKINNHQQKLLKNAKNIRHYPDNIIRSAREKCNKWETKMHSRVPIDVSISRLGAISLQSIYFELRDEIHNSNQIIFNGRMLRNSPQYFASNKPIIMPKLHWHEWWNIKNYKSTSLDHQNSFLSNIDIPDSQSGVDCLCDKVYIRCVVRDVYFCIYLKNNPSTSFISSSLTNAVLPNTDIEQWPFFGLYSLSKNKMIFEQRLDTPPKLFQSTRIIIHVFKNFIIMTQPHPQHKSGFVVKIRLFALKDDRLINIANTDHSIENPDNRELKYLVGGIGATDEFIMIYFNFQSKQPIALYDWKLQYIKSKGLHNKFARDNHVRWFGCANNCFIIQNNNNVTLIDSETNEVVGSFSAINIIALDQKFNIIAGTFEDSHSATSKTHIAKYKFYGEKLSSSELVGFSNHLIPCVDPDGDISFIDLEKKLFLFHLV